MSEGKKKIWRKGPRNAAARSIGAPDTSFASPFGGQMDTLPGIMIRLLWDETKGNWAVLVIDWACIADGWRPGKAVPFTRMPLSQWINEMEDELELPKTFMTQV